MRNTFSIFRIVTAFLIKSSYKIIMEKLRHASQSETKRFILNTALLLISAITSFSLLSQRTKKSTWPHANDPKNPVPYPPGANPHTSSTFHKLRLTKEQFETLRSYGGNTLVFQFFYPQASNCGSPTLYAYTMKKRHRAIKRPPEVLSYGAPTQEPLTGRALVLGDVQIEIRKLERLIKRVTGSSNEHFYNLVFTPRFLPDNPHETYDISVDGSGEFETANPSPPF